MEASLDMTPRRDLWHRYRPFDQPDRLELIVFEIADDLDHADAQQAKIVSEIQQLRAEQAAKFAKLTGIALGLLISVTTGILMIAFQMMTGR